MICARSEGANDRSQGWSAAEPLGSLRRVRSKP